MTRVKLAFNHLTQILIYLSIFLLSFQIKFLILPHNISPQGTYNQFTSLFIYAYEIVALCAVFTWSIELIRGTKKLHYLHPYFSTLLLFLLFAIGWGFLIAHDKTAAFATVAHYFFGGIFFFVLINHPKETPLFIKAFIAGLFFQAILALLQFIFQESIGLQFLGEPFINKNLSGIAKIKSDDITFIRSYGTLPHPNLLGAFLSIGFMLSFFLRKKVATYIVIGIFTLALLTTFSRAALLGLITSLIYFLHITQWKIRGKAILIGGILGLIVMLGFALSPLRQGFSTISHSTSINERLEQIKISFNIFLHQPLGLGLNQFTLEMHKFTSNKLAPWEFQPVHNMPLLAGAELGVLFTVFPLLLLFFLYSTCKKERLKLISHQTLRRITLLGSITIMLFFLMMFDHFFYTLPQGIALLSFVLALFNTIFVQKERHIRPIYGKK